MTDKLASKLNGQKTIKERDMKKIQERNMSSMAERDERYEKEV